MSYTFNRGVADRKMPKGYEANKLASKDHAERNPNKPEIQQKHIELAEVVNVIRSSEDPDFTRTEDIGKAKIRRVVSEFDRSEEGLGYARPIDGRKKDYPIENELVVVIELNNRPFYFQTANWRQNPNQNTAPKFSVSKVKGEKGKQKEYQDAQKGVTRTSGSDGEINPEGDAFEVRTDVKPLRHRPGDMTLEGRVGNSIRLGRDSEMNPLMQFRVGQREEVTNSDFLKPFFEDVNKDPTSLYLTSPEVEFPLAPEETSTAFEPATIDFDDHLSSAESPPENYNGAQILAASDRIALNAKEKQLVGFSKAETSFVTLANFTIDTKKKIKTLSIEGNLHKTEKDFSVEAEENFKVNAEDKIETVSKNGHLHETEADFDVLPEGLIHLATETENEPAVRGQQLVDRLTELIQALLAETHPTPAGPSGPPTNAAQYQTTLQKIKETIRSEKIYVDEKQ